MASEIKRKTNSVNLKETDTAINTLASKEDEKESRQGESSFFSLGGRMKMSFKKTSERHKLTSWPRITVM